MAAQCRNGMEGLFENLNEKDQRREHMIYQILFLGLSVVIAANILVVVVALPRAYREERRVDAFRLRCR